MRQWLIGGASGELAHLLQERTDVAEVTVFDIVDDLLAIGRESCPSDVQFQWGDVLDAETMGNDSVDISLLIGVHSIFDDPMRAFTNLIDWSREYVVIFGLFNDYDIDVWVRYRDVHKHPSDHREPGWNMVSKHSVQRFLTSMDIASDAYTFTPIEYPTERSPVPDDPALSWTFTDAYGDRLWTNGLRLLLNGELLTFRL